MLSHFHPRVDARPVGHDVDQGRVHIGHALEQLAVEVAVAPYQFHAPGG